MDVLKISASRLSTGGHFRGGWLNKKVKTVPMARSACSVKPRGGDAAALTLYGVLGVEAEESSADDIKRAYKDLARRYHPDTNPPEDHEACTKKFLEVRSAYEVLSDLNKRSEYDFAMANPMLAQAYGNSSWSRGSSPQYDDGFDPWRFQ